MIARYGDVRFDFGRLRNFSQETVYDENTDYLYTKFRVTIAALCHAQSVGGITQNVSLGGSIATSLIDGQYVQTGAAGQFNSLRLYLMSPRQEFSLQMGNRIFLHAGAVSTVAAGAKVTLQLGEEPVPLNADVMNGPRPVDCKVTNFAGDTAMHVEWTVEICIRECAGGEPSPQVLGNRWSMSDDIGEDKITTRTMEGVLHLIAGSINPHSLRGLVLPPLAKGFRRERMTFAATPDLSKLKYTIVDREMHFATPEPAATWSLNYSEDFNRIKIVGTCRVVMNGSRLSNKTQMRFNAARIAFWKVLGDRRGDSMITHVVINDTSSEKDNRIEVTVQGERIGALGDDSLKLGAGRVTLVLDSTSMYQGSPVISNYDKEAAPNPGTSGTASIFGAFVAALQDACQPDHKFTTVAAPGVPSTGEGTSLPTLQAYQVDTIDDTLNPEYSASHEGHMYVSYRSESRYHTTRNRASGDLAMPQAPPPPPPSPGEEPTEPTPTYPYDTTVVFDLGPPSTRRTLMIQAERVGDWPEFPDPEDFTDENGVKNSVMDHTIQLGTAEVMPDESLLYRATMNVTFQLARLSLKATGAVSDAATIGAGFIPWLKPESKLQTKPFTLAKPTPIDIGAGSGEGAPGQQTEEN